MPHSSSKADCVTVKELFWKSDFKLGLYLMVNLAIIGYRETISERNVTISQIIASETLYRTSYKKR